MGSFNLSPENAVLEKPQSGGQIDRLAFLGLKKISIEASFTH